jgi:hypothetical protein
MFFAIASSAVCKLSFRIYPHFLLTWICFPYLPKFSEFLVMFPHCKRCFRNEQVPQEAQGKCRRTGRSFNDMLCFDIIKQPRSSQGAVKEAMKEMDAAEALLLLQKLRCKDTSSDALPEVDYSGIEPAVDNPDEVLMACSDKRTSSVECNSHPVVEIEERLSCNAIDSSDVVQKENQKLNKRLEFATAMAVINLMNFKPERNSASVDVCGSTEKCVSEALLVEEAELTLNDDGRGIVVCPKNSAMMELKRPKLDLKVSDKSENPASDDAQGGINDASGKQTSLTEPMAREADQEPELKLDASEKQAAKGTMSADEPGTFNPGEASGGDNSDEVVTFCPEKSSCSVECYGGGEGTSDLKEAASPSSAYHYGGTEKSRNEAPVVEDEELSRKHSRQALADCPEKSAVIEVERKNPKLHDLVLDNSVVMQEEKQKVYLDAPAPSDSSEEESSDIIDGEVNPTA